MSWNCSFHSYFSSLHRLCSLISARVCLISKNLPIAAAVVRIEKRTSKLHAWQTGADKSEQGAGADDGMARAIDEQTRIII